MTPWKSWTQWVILLVQESYLLYINLDYKNYTTILRYHMQPALDAIIGENHSAAVKNRTILSTFSTISNVIEVKQLSCLNIFGFS